MSSFTSASVCSLWPPLQLACPPTTSGLPPSSPASLNIHPCSRRAGCGQQPPVLCGVWIRPIQFFQGLVLLGQGGGIIYIIGAARIHMAWGGLFLTLGRPTQEHHKSCLAAAGGFNYDAALHGATRPKSEAAAADDAETSDKAAMERGYFVNRSRVLIGSGADTFHHAKSALLSWRHLALGWANVEPDTPVKVGTRFCISYKELIPWVWVLLPLQIAYVSDARPKDGGKQAMFAFGSGTLQGHMLAGEERFSVQVDEEDRVWYEVASLSKPAHILASLCYPYVQLRQKHFARQSGQALLNHVHVAASCSSNAQTIPIAQNN
ncbi:hypothetical protein U9M48_005797 [Paspalum notatum var. saurae]|uniref:DUF1990 domain-containing protein n=1 Tax=Paspalum notatum var. saurae TaxID=547442 RepID=A0AAQ3PYF1_PASNO